MLVMAKTDSLSDDQHAFVQRSSLYQEFLAEREEILKHKWLESERAGEDIGFEKALLDSPKFDLEKFKRDLQSKDMYGNDQVSKQHVIQAASNCNLNIR